MRKFIQIFSVLLLLTIVSGWRSFNVVFDRVEYKSNKEFADTKIDIVNVTGETAINAHINVATAIDDVELSFCLAMEDSEGKYVTLINRTIHFCKFLNNKSIDPLVKAIYEEMLKSGSLFKSCPITKGVYYLHEFRIDEEMLPSYVPEANFYALLSFRTKKNGEIFGGKFYGRVDKSKGFDNLKIFSMG